METLNPTGTQNLLAGGSRHMTVVLEVLKLSISPAINADVL